MHVGESRNCSSSMQVVETVSDFKSLQPPNVAEKITTR